jgi:hypothetical protein
MRSHRFFHIAGKVFIDSSRGVFRQQSKALLNRPPQRHGRLQHCHSQCAILNNDFRSGADSGQKAREVAGRLGSRDVDRCHTMMISLFFSHSS